MVRASATYARALLVVSVAAAGVVAPGVVAPGPASAAGATHAPCHVRHLLTAPVRLPHPLSIKDRRRFSRYVVMTQDALNGLGYGGPSCLLLDGHFGPATRAAVIRLQAAQQGRADGVVDARTWNQVMWALGAFGE